MKILIIFLLFTSFLFSRDITFGVVPQQSPVILAKKWIPITKELSKLTGHNIIFQTKSTIPKFEEALYAGQYDMAYISPYHIVIVDKTLNYEAIIRANKQIQGIIVTHKNNNVDLTKKNSGNFFFPAPKAFAATLLTKYELKKKYNIDVDTTYNSKYVNSHDSVYKGVSRNLALLGGGIVRTYKNLSDKNAKNKLKIIYKTDKYPSHPIALSNKIPDEIKKSIQDAFLQVSKEKLHKLNIEKLIKTSNQEYGLVKELAIELDIYK